MDRDVRAIAILVLLILLVVIPGVVLSNKYAPAPQVQCVDNVQYIRLRGNHWVPHFYPDGTLHECE